MARHFQSVINQPPAEPPQHSIAAGHRSRLMFTRKPKPVIIKVLKPLTSLTKKVPEPDDALSTNSNESVERKGSTWKNILHRTGHLRLTFQDLKGKGNPRSAKFLGISSADENNPQNEDLEKGTAKDTVSPLGPHLDCTPDGQNAERSELTRTNMPATERRTMAESTRIERKYGGESAIAGSSKEEGVGGDNTEILATAVIAKTNTSMDEEYLTPSPGPIAFNQLPDIVGEGTQPERIPTALEASRAGQHDNQNFVPPLRAGIFKGKDKLADIPEGSHPTTQHPSIEAMPAPEQLLRPEPPRARRPLVQLDELLIKVSSLISRGIYSLSHMS